MTEQHQASSLRKNWRSALLMVIILAASAGIFLGAYFLGLLSPVLHPASVHFTITESNQGFNESANHSPPWPIMDAFVGQTVTILIVNNDTVSSHGFVISHYFDGGVELRPGESHTVTFVANQRGDFLVYCNIICPVHPSMQNGQLKVGL